MTSASLADSTFPFQNGLFPFYFPGFQPTSAIFERGCFVIPIDGKISNEILDRLIKVEIRIGKVAFAQFNEGHLTNIHLCPKSSIAADPMIHGKTGYISIGYDHNYKSFSHVLINSPPIDYEEQTKALIPRIQSQRMNNSEEGRQRRQKCRVRLILGGTVMTLIMGIWLASSR